MCSYDVYRVKRKEAPKKPRKLRDLVKDEVIDVEYVCASARLAEVVEILGK
jgi:hypothetical protein